jgi:hypothetical protein
MKKIYWILFLIVFSITAFAEKIAVFPDLKRPRDIIIDHDRMFISDCPEIYIYSLKDFNLIKKFGREGTGPGEFKPTVIHFKINVQPDYIFVNSTHKVSFFTKEGNLLREMNAGGIGHGFFAFGDRMVGRREIQEGNTGWTTLTLFDSRLNPLKELSRIRFAIDEKEVKVLQSSTIVEASKDKIFTIMSPDFEIKIFDYNGKLLHIIKRENPEDRVKVNESHKKAVHEYMKLRWRGYPGIKDRLVFPEYLPAIWGLKYHCREENEELYVLSRKARDNKTECFVFNIRGKLLKKIYLPLKEKNVYQLFPFDIKDGKLYQLIENEDTENYELSVTEIQ